MTSSSEEPSNVVVDAGFTVLTVLPYASRDTVLERFAGWYRADRRVLAPALWLGEAVSVIRKQSFLEILTEAESETAVEDLLALGIESIPIDLELCRGALRWAGRLGQARAYDGFYLALAERYEASFWTTDRRLGKRLEQVGSELPVHQLPSQP